MNRACFVWIILLFVKCAVAQDACPEFPRLMAEADSFAALNLYHKALNKYNSAKTCDPAQRAKVDEKINKLFDKISAESEMRLAMSQTLQAEKMKKQKEAEKRQRD